MAVVVADSLPKEAAKRAVDKPIKSYMKTHFQDAGIPYRLMHHPSGCDPNLQVADYMCWAIQRKIVLGKEWPYMKVSDAIREIGFVAGGKQRGD